MTAPDLSTTMHLSSDPLLTAAEVGELLGVPASWVYEQARQGRIPTVPLGRYRRFRRTAVEAWVIELEERALDKG